MFSIPLIVDRRLSAWQAIKTSTKRVTKSWFKIFFFVLLISVILIISIIPLGIGLIWSLPFAYNAYAEFYKSLFGIMGLDPITVKEV